MTSAKKQSERAAYAKWECEGWRVRIHPSRRPLRQARAVRVDSAADDVSARGTGNHPLSRGPIGR